MDDVYVIEIIGSGEHGVPEDIVVEVGVCHVFADGSDYETVFDGRISIDPRDLGKESLDYLSRTYGLNPEDLYLGEEPDSVVGRFQHSVFGRECTSFDVSRTFGQFLSFEPWDCTGELTLLPSYRYRLPGRALDAPEGTPPLAYAYGKICPGDPACVRGGRHAVDLAQMSASIVCVLRRNGLF